MYISELIIDGFKSYASRTVLKNFDQSFNAITGLNGSGKSNILDAICFVLGISNLSQVRVSNLQELVYKSGQSGVTKASVTIVFDNSDKKNSPVGYEEYSQITVTRQVVIGGRNKYLINGHNAQLNRVQNLFHSVQLNVNNPHFLIMQGRITKVLNMKPQEILGMIEEAAGTRMFEMKKQAAKKTISKKQKKLQEIDRVLDEEITPTLDKLRSERTKYIQWSQNKEECSQLERFCIAYQYYKNSKLLEENEDKTNEIEEECEELKNRQISLSNQIKEIENQVKEIKSKQSDEMRDEFKDLENAVNDLSKDLVKYDTMYQHKEKEIVQEKEQLEKIRKNILTIQEQITNISQQKKPELKTKLEAKKKETKEISTLLSNLQSQLQAVNAGIAASSTFSGKTLTEASMECKQQIDEVSAEIKKCEVSSPRLKKDISETERSIISEKSSFQKLEKQKAYFERELETLENKIKELDYDPMEHQELIDQKNGIEKELKELKVELSELKSSNDRFSLNYDKRAVNPEKINGSIASLFNMVDDKAAIALEVTAGGRLYHIVCENEKVAKDLIKNGKTDRRITVIPLNKIKHTDLTPSTVALAKTHDATPALMWIKYDKSVEPAMKYVFGQTFICSSLDQAEKVAYNKRILKRTVTFEGDSFDPSGTLTGGSRSNDIDSKLKKLSLYKEKKEKYVELYKKYTDEIISNLQSMNQTKKEYNELKQKVELKKHELDLLESRMKSSKHHMMVERLDALQEQLEKMNSEKEENQIKLSNLKKKYEEIEAEINQYENDSNGANKEQQSKRIENEILETKKKLIVSKQEAQKLEQSYEKFGIELEEMNNEIEELNNQQKNQEELIQSLEKELTKSSKIVESKKRKYDQKNDELNKKKELIHSTNEELENLMNEKENLRKEQTNCNLESKKLNHTLTKINKEIQDAQKELDVLVKSNPWIRKEKEYFGEPNSQYDFSSAENMSSIRDKLHKLRSQQDKLSKTINKKVMSMFEKAEQEYEDLMRKKQTVEKDKEKIEQVMEELDEKKKDAIKTTWKKVNRDFGSIFSTLLPGTNCKLEPLEGKTVLDGLEVKVAFGEVWKESLTELSGGQRSLLALSIILSLLLFKPAPMYILDEIDAALDPSHTQNIGKMLRTHFKNSQFIVVSLKEGMFQNANVLFRTKFVNGSSGVIRTTPSNSMLNSSNTERNDTSFLDSDEEMEKENEHPNNEEQVVSSKQKRTNTKTRKRKRT